jgi:glycogen(starch) synthase
VSPPPHILMTADTVGGVWTYAVTLCRALSTVRFTLAAMGGPPSAAQARQAAALPNVDLVEGSFKLEWMHDPWADVAAAGEWLLSLERDVGADAVHLNGFAHGSLRFRSPVVVVGHSCVASWWRAVRREPAPAAWDRYRSAVTDGLRSADLVVAPSQAMLDALHAHYGPLPRAMVIYNGTDAPATPPAAKEPFVFVAGRLWDEAKNVSALAAVAPRLAWPVRLAGDAGNASFAGVRLMGRLDPAQMEHQLQAAGIYALPARYEPFGLSVLEAARAGCPLVLGDIASLREIWGDSALYVDPDDLNALTETLRGLIDSPTRRADLGRRAAERSRRYSVEAMAGRYLSAYRQLLHAPAAGLMVTP